MVYVVRHAGAFADFARRFVNDVDFLFKYLAKHLMSAPTLGSARINFMGIIFSISGLRRVGFVAVFSRPFARGLVQFVFVKSPVLSAATVAALPVSRVIRGIALAKRFRI